MSDNDFMEPPPDDYVNNPTSRKDEEESEEGLFVILFYGSLRRVNRLFVVLCLFMIVLFWLFRLFTCTGVIRVIRCTLPFHRSILVIQVIHLCWSY